MDIIAPIVKYNSQTIGRDKLCRYVAKIMEFFVALCKQNDTSHLIEYRAYVNNVFVYIDNSYNFIICPRLKIRWMR